MTPPPDRPPQPPPDPPVDIRDYFHATNPTPTDADRALCNLPPRNN